jgi:hypothetical protein
MKTVKMSLATIQGKLSRAEMKNIMAGSGSECDPKLPCSGAACNISGSYQWGTCSPAIIGGTELCACYIN